MVNKGQGQRARVFLPMGALTLYEQPDRKSVESGDVTTGDWVMWYPESKTRGKFLEFYYVEGERGSGWMPSLFGQAEFAVEQTARPVREEVNEALDKLAQTIREFADWLVSPQGQGAFA